MIAAQMCPAGEKRLADGEPCIPSILANYLYCLKSSGGGKIEIVRKDDAGIVNRLEVNVGGKGSGVIIKGEASGGVKKEEASRAVMELAEKLDPSLAQICERLAKPASVERTRPRAAEPARTMAAGGTADASTFFTRLKGSWTASESVAPRNPWECGQPLQTKRTVSVETLSADGRTMSGQFEVHSRCPDWPRAGLFRSGKATYAVTEGSPSRVLGTFLTTSCSVGGQPCDSDGIGTKSTMTLELVDSAVLRSDGGRLWRRK